MPQVEHALTTYPQGINTEASLLSFPEGYTIDEENFELSVDGSRRKRAGLQLENDGLVTSGIDLMGTTSPSNDVVRAFKWESAGTDNSRNFVVMQVGKTLYIYSDTRKPSAEKMGAYIDLSMTMLPSATTQLLRTTPVDISFGRGLMFVCGKYIEPFYVSFQTDPDIFQATPIDCLQRDFDGYDDGISNLAQPTSAPASHVYNLYNRGWNSTILGTFFSGQSTYPSKAMVPHLGFQRATVSGVADVDGTKQFSDAKLVAELFGDASAPVGAIRKSCWSGSAIDPQPGHQYSISTWSIAGTTAGTQTVTVQTVGNHGLSVSNEIRIEGHLAKFNATGPNNFYGVGSGYFSLNGTYAVASVPASNTITISVTFPPGFSSWSEQYFRKGSLNYGITNVSLIPSSTRPSTCAFFAGRLWLAGVDSETLSHKIYFSQVGETDSQWGKFYQQANPCDERISDLVATDGGVITIPDAGTIIKLLHYDKALLVFATNGVWEIGPGPGGYFSATGYSVRRITDKGCVSKLSVILAENTPLYWGYSDIWAIVIDTNTGFLTAQNVSSSTINTLYNSIPATSRALAQSVYDDSNKVVYWLYTLSDDDRVLTRRYGFTNALIYNIRLQAFTKYSFTPTSTFLGTAFATKKTYESPYEKMKWVMLTVGANTLTICDMTDRDTFKDLGNDEMPCYVKTGYDVVQDVSRRKVAPYVHVFMNRTESAYDPDTGKITGGGSLYMQACWDWADRSTSGKWGTSQQVYRHPRAYTPSGTEFDDGQPIVATRNKVRGRGRALFLSFTGETGKDAWLAGIKYDYNVNKAA